MKPEKLVKILFVCAALFVQGEAGDIDIVKSILQKNGLLWNAEELVTMKDDRVIKLNLNNNNFGKDGISQLLPQIGQLTELQELTLNDNDLIVLPDEIYNCTKLTVLEIQNNNLISLAPGIRKLSQLRELDLRNNELHALPIDIVALKHLVKLQLWGNELSSLPSQIGALISLKELYLRGNRLTGLPESITRLHLTYLDILENRLCRVTNRVDWWLKTFDENYATVQYCVSDYHFKEKH